MQALKLSIINLTGFLKFAGTDNACYLRFQLDFPEKIVDPEMENANKENLKALKNTALKFAQSSQYMLFKVSTGPS